MGFIMNKGPGTAEILEQLFEAFYANVQTTSAFAEIFTGNRKDLLAAAVELGIMPTDKRHQLQWKKWLRWIARGQRKNSHHDAICQWIHAALTRTDSFGNADPVPIVCDWEEDDSANPPVVVTIVPASPTIDPGTRLLHILVKTKKASEMGAD